MPIYQHEETGRIVEAVHWPGTGWSVVLPQDYDKAIKKGRKINPGMNPELVLSELTVSVPISRQLGEAQYKLNNAFAALALECPVSIAKDLEKRVRDVVLLTEQQTNETFININKASASHMDALPVLIDFVKEMREQSGYVGERARSCLRDWDTARTKKPKKDKEK